MFIAMKKIIHIIFIFSGLVASHIAFSADPIALESEFNVDEVKWVKEPGNSSISGEAFIKLKINKMKGCAGFNVELLPVAPYANERILKTYGNNDHGQVLLEDNPPKFTPDAKDYHDMVIKSSCDERNEFVFNNVNAGEYYVIAFIIFDTNEEGRAAKSGGAVMK
jgi:hypothetical protein